MLIVLVLGDRIIFLLVDTCESIDNRLEEV